MNTPTRKSFGSVCMNRGDETKKGFNNVMLLEFLQTNLRDKKEFERIVEKLGLEMPKRLGWDGNYREMSIKEAI